MSDMSSLGKLEDGIIDLSNRPHRNTLIFPNIPEGSKGVDVDNVLMLLRISIKTIRALKWTVLVK